MAVITHGKIHRTTCGITNDIVGGDKMIMLWITLGILSGSLIAIARNTDERCREAKGIIAGVILSSMLWIGGIILWKYLS